MTLCLSCLIVVEKNLKCSKCLCASYCSRECQVKHWPIHKELCLDSNSESDLHTLLKKADNFDIQGNYEKAEKVSKKCLKIVGEMKKGQVDDFVLHIAHRLAVMKKRQGKSSKMAEAAAILREYMGKYISQYNENSAKTSSIMLTMRGTLADLLCTDSQFEEAEVIYKEVLQSQRSLNGANDITTIDTMNQLATLYLATNRLSEAEQMMTVVLALKRKLLGDYDERTFVAMNILGIIIKKLGRHEEALKIIKDCFEKKTERLGENHVSTLASQYNLCDIYLAKGDYSNAIIQLETYLVKAKKFYGPNHMETLRALNELAIAKALL